MGIMLIADDYGRKQEQITGCTLFTSRIKFLRKEPEREKTSRTEA
jgi:hypothetical protein